MKSIVRPAQRVASSRWTSQIFRQSTRSLSIIPRHPPPSVLRQSISPRLSVAPIKRYNSSLSVPGQQNPPAEENRDEPSYELSFTCKPCLYRSSHRITKHGYHKGTVLVTCPSCKSRHVISDHLKIFMDTKSTLEDILRKKADKGQDFTKLLKKGTLGIRQGELVGNEGEEDLEFWEDGTETVHTPIEEKRASQESTSKD